MNNEKSILFSGEMVNAILSGRKTQTRRVVKPIYKDGSDLSDVVKWHQPYSLSGHKSLFDTGGQYWDTLTKSKHNSNGSLFRYSSRRACPYGKVGDSLWLRETWANLALEGYAPIYVFRADGEESGVKWKSPIFMPRAASRINLEITNIRVERLQDISEDDMEAEGIKVDPDWAEFCLAMKYFAEKWDALNKKRGFSWKSNPFVWVIEFKKAEAK